MPATKFWNWAWLKRGRGWDWRMLRNKPGIPAAFQVIVVYQEARLSLPHILIASRAMWFVSFIISEEPAALGWMAAISPDLPIPWLNLSRLIMMKRWCENCSNVWEIESKMCEWKEKGKTWEDGKRSTFSLIIVKPILWPLFHTIPDHALFLSFAYMFFIPLLVTYEASSRPMCHQFKCYHRFSEFQWLFWGKQGDLLVSHWHKNWTTWNVFWQQAMMQLYPHVPLLQHYLQQQLVNITIFHVNWKWRYWPYKWRYLTMF